MNSNLVFGQAVTRTYNMQKVLRSTVRRWDGMPQRPPSRMVLGPWQRLAVSGSLYYLVSNRLHAFLLTKSAACIDKFVGQDQLIGGTWPDNEPAVSCMDWQTGQVNSKYWVTSLLAKTVGGKQSKTILNSTVNGQSRGNSSVAYVMPYELDTPDNSRGMLLVNKRGTPVTFAITGATGGLASCVDGSGAGDDGPGFAPPIVKPISASGELTLGAYGVAVVTQLLGEKHEEL